MVSTCGSCGEPNFTNQTNTYRSLCGAPNVWRGKLWPATKHPLTLPNLLTFIYFLKTTRYDASTCTVIHITTGRQYQTHCYGIISTNLAGSMLSEYKGQVDSLSSPIALYIVIYQKEILGAQNYTYSYTKQGEKPRRTIICTER